MSAPRKQPKLTDEVLDTLALLQDGEALTIDNAADSAMDFIILYSDSTDPDMQKLKDLQYIKTMVRQLIPNEI
jgi:hypothetical protein